MASITFCSEYCTFEPSMKPTAPIRLWCKSRQPVAGSPWTSTSESKTRSEGAAMGPDRHTTCEDGLVTSRQSMASRDATGESTAIGAYPSDCPCRLETRSKRRAKQARTANAASRRRHLVGSSASCALVRPDHFATALCLANAGWAEQAAPTAPETRPGPGPYVEGT